MTKPTAAMPLPLLLDYCARAGWAGLERRHAVALRALAAVLPHRSAAGVSTANQLADAAGYSTRWTRTALAELEALGLVEWHRGGVVDGSPTPSVFRVVKAQLVALLPAMRDALAELRQRRAVDTAARVAGLTVRPGRRVHRRRSAHAEVAASPTPRREVTEGAGGPSSVPFGTGTPPTGSWRSLVAALRAENR